MKRAILPVGAAVVVLATVVAVFAQAPVVDIDIHKNRNLWKAQRNIVIAFESIQEAQKLNPRDQGRHAQKARDLLIQANKELKLAAEAGSKH